MGPDGIGDAPIDGAIIILLITFVVVLAVAGIGIILERRK